METVDNPVAADEPQDQGQDPVEVTQTYQGQRVVGLGGSAGSIPAFREFFAGLPSDTGAAFVVVMHLSPEHESRLAQVLQQHTSMPVTQVNDTVEIEPNSVYVIPPGRDLQIIDGTLHLAETERGRGKRISVDLLFRTLADTHGPSAVAIIFSGSDSDGSIGIKRIKENGGLTVAQDPLEAEHDNMPRASIGTGMVDWVLAAAEMPGRLVNYWEQERRLRLPDVEVPTLQAHRPSGLDTESEHALRGILGHLRTRTGREFSYYKRATILRRIARRMQVNGVEDMAAYLSFLNSNPGEAGALLQDLLISVTNFFRDPESFAGLQKYIPSLFANKVHSDSVRVWVPACATGEEAYSVAIMLCEYAATLENPPAIQVFATDLDEQAVRIGRAAYYSDLIAADVSEERLRRYFTRDHGGFVVKRELREVVLFAVHDLLKDASFSRCDLVTCRNLLIYLNREAQRRAMEVFHFSLRPEGKLFLGSSELLEEGNGLFSVEDKAHRIYSRRAVKGVNLPVPIGPGTMTLDLGKSPVAPPYLSPVAAGKAGPGLTFRESPLSRSQLHFRLVERYAPPSVVVNDEHDIVHLSEHAGKYLEFSGGDPTVNLLRVVHSDLRIPLRTALFRAGQSGNPVEVDGGLVVLGGESQRVRLRVVPIREGEGLYLLVLFDTQPEAPAESSAVSSPEPVMQHLELELEQVKMNLRETVEQYEATTEELKASNEELLAMNEELRSASEELETSREELQSINEELSAVNVELKSKVDEVGRANSDLQNLMASTAIATVFLDRELRISRYTPAAVSLFNLIPTDLGRPFSDLNTRLHYRDLVTDAGRVLENLGLIEREARHVDGRWFYTRLLPYRTTDDRIGGVVLTLIDITSRKEAEETVRANDVILQADLEAMKRLLEVSERFVKGEPLPSLLEAIGSAACASMETTMASVHLMDDERGSLSIVASEGLSATILAHLEADEKAMEYWTALLREGRTVAVEDAAGEGPFDDGEGERVLEKAGVGAFAAVPLRTRAGRSLGILTCFFHGRHRPADRQLRLLELTARQAADAIERMRSAEDLHQSEERLRVAVQAGGMGTWDWDFRTDRIVWSVEHNRMLGLPEEQSFGTREEFVQRLHPEDRDRVEGSLQAAQRGEGQYLEEFRALQSDGTYRWIAGTGQLLLDDQKRPERMIGVVRDITSRKDAAEALEKSRGGLLKALQETEQARADGESANQAKDNFLAMLSHELRTPLTPVLMGVRAMEREPDLPEMARDALAMIRRNVANESRLIDDLLDITRISRGKLEIVRGPMNLHEAVRHAIEIAEGDIRGRKHRLEVDLKAEKYELEADRLRLEQVFWNLLKNASKFMEQGGAIAVRSWNGEGTISVSVEDHGVGIAAESLDTIFDAFAQENVELAKEFGGLGLGLAIAKATVEAHGGILKVHSDGRGLGTTFTATLPLDAPPADGGDANQGSP